MSGGGGDTQVSGGRQAVFATGALDENPRQCRMSILRNGDVAYLCRLFSSMSHVQFKKMSHVNTF